MAAVPADDDLFGHPDFITGVAIGLGSVGGLSAICGLVWYYCCGGRASMSRTELQSDGGATDGQERPGRKRPAAADRAAASGRSGDDWAKSVMKGAHGPDGMVSNPLRSKKGKGAVATAAAARRRGKTPDGSPASQKGRGAQLGKLPSRRRKRGEDLSRAAREPGGAAAAVSSPSGRDKGADADKAGEGTVRVGSVRVLRKSLAIGRSDGPSGLSWHANKGRGARRSTPASEWATGTGITSLGHKGDGGVGRILKPRLMDDDDD